MKSPVKIGENRILGSISSLPIPNVLSVSMSAKQKSIPNHVAKMFRSNDENAVPADPNVQADYHKATPFTKHSPRKSPSSSPILKSHGQVEILANLDSYSQVKSKSVLATRRTNSVPNEIKEEDAEDEPLGDQIRQLKEELIRTKSAGYAPDRSRSCYFARDSLNQLRESINRSLVISCENKIDSEEQEMIVDDSNMRNLSEHIEKLHTSCDGNTIDSTRSSFASASCEVNSMSADGDLEDVADSSGISISLPHPTTVLEEPTFSESPKIRNCRKSMAASTKFLASSRNISESSNLRNTKQSSMSRHFPDPTESLATSLQRGLMIIENHQRSSMSNRSSVSFSFDHLALKPGAEADDIYASVQIIKEDKPPEAGLSELPLCPSCKQKFDGEVELTKTSDGEYPTEVVKETYEKKQVEEDGKTYFDLNEKENLLKEIADLKSKLKPNNSTENLRSSLLLRSIQLQKNQDATDTPQNDVFEKERERWTEMESEWISLTDDLRQGIEHNRRHAEDLEMELRQEKKSTEELNDALGRAMLGHSRFIEQYTELQEKYNELAEKHHVTKAGVADIHKAAARAAAKGRHGKRFAKCFTAELSAIRAEKEKEMETLKKENKNLKAQLRDTAEAVQAAGDLLVRLREAEQGVQASEERMGVVEEENKKLKKQIEKLKSKHKSEMSTMKQYLAESRLPGTALQPWYKNEESESLETAKSVNYDDYGDNEAWRVEFGAIYQDHHYR